ncbi:MAG: hypothetical protein ABIR37_03610 [Candidatus Saccharimonadales bacterium]
MELVRILKRRDGAALVVGIVLALFVESAVRSWAIAPADWFSGRGGVAYGSRGTHSLRDDFWFPLVLLILELVIFELFVRIFLAVAARYKKR